jgi:diamine N-acetyltransferase
VSLAVRPASAADIEPLARLAQCTFHDTYTGTVPADALADHIGAHFHAAAIGMEVADPACHVWLAEDDEMLLGYVLFRQDQPPPPGLEAARPMVLERLYVRASAHGRGVGRALLSAAVDLAGDHGHDVVWLTVWERNPRAIAFYLHQGFQDVGAFSFLLGGEPQTDRLMVLHLPRG